jgi:hypothetical protein
MLVISASASQLHLSFFFFLVLVDHTKYLHQHPSAEEDFPSEENIAAPVIRLVEKEKTHASPPTGSNLVVKQTSLASNNADESTLDNKGKHYYALRQ